MYKEPLFGIEAKGICHVNGNNDLSYSSVTRWCKKFRSDVVSLKDEQSKNCNIAKKG